MGAKNSIQAAALKYAAQGFAVFPCWPENKHPATRNGFLDATTDEQTVRRFFRGTNKMIGIATGELSGGLVIVDLDKDAQKGKDGLAVLREWEKEHGAFPKTVQVITPRGGRHLWFRGHGFSSATAIYDGVDIRANGGYACAPPSVRSDGKEYRFEAGCSLDEASIAAIDKNVEAFIRSGNTKKQSDKEKEPFRVPDLIEEGHRTDMLIRLCGSLRSKGLTDEAIRAAVMAENESRCVPPLSDAEMEKTVFPCLSREWSIAAPYTGNNQAPKPKPSTVLTCLDDVEEQSVDWLIPRFMPRGEITLLGGDGGQGKSFCWCAIAAGVSRGEYPTFLQPAAKDVITKLPGGAGRVLYFSGEDSTEKTLKNRLKACGADMQNIYCLTTGDDRLRDLTFDSEFLRDLCEQWRPTLCIFDPLQSFIVKGTRMEARNDMRQTLQPLNKLGVDYGTSFLIACHTNKRSGVWGRTRLADSSDLWDIARSVIFVGATEDKTVRYFSHEKTNYQELMPTVLFSIEGAHNKVRCVYKGLTDKRDREFQTGFGSSNKRPAPARVEAKEYIMDILSDGEEWEMKELDKMLKAMGVSHNTAADAKKELADTGEIVRRMEKCGKNTLWFIRSSVGCPLDSNTIGEMPDEAAKTLKMNLRDAVKKP